MNRRSEVICVATSRELKRWTDPRFTYARTPFHGTKTWIKLRPPSKEDPFTKEPFKRFRREE
jgi:hypothetical protein